jgi:hypothetical protein
MTKKQSAFALLALMLSMLTFIIFIFYSSEPKFVDNISPNQKIVAYDYISLPDRMYENIGSESNQYVNNGLVLQTDGISALVKVDETYKSNMIQINVKDHQYRIVGKGTWYHKVNQYVGFNIMIITQILIGFLLAIVAITQSKLLSEILY